MTPRELLVSTVQFYTSNNRAIWEPSGICIYLKTETSPGCAIGRHLTSEVQQTFHKIQIEDCAGSIKSMFDNTETKRLLPDWMQEMDADFLQQIQQLHDGQYYWNAEGISALGKQEVSSICNTFALEPLTEEEFGHRD